MLTAQEMGMPYTPENKLGYDISFALKGGYPVGHVYDTSPALQNVIPEGRKTFAYISKDSGLTWEVCGYWYDGRLSEPGSHDCYVALEEDE